MIVLDLIILDIAHLVMKPNWIGPDYRRASGEVICEICNKEYRKHPLDVDNLGYNGKPYLNRLCDGSLVKL